jgi:beta-barrel assembly-enhancing protease
MRRTAIAIAFTLAASSAFAQFGDILKRIDPSKIGKTAKVAREATREFTEAEEADIGRVVAARVLATYPMSNDEKEQKYVTLVGNTVAAFSARPTLDWHFAVIKAPIVNAFSTPGGFIFITSGAMKQISNEAELAAVLAHEIGHVTQKHILKEVKRGNIISAGVDLAQSTQAGGQWLNDDMGKKIGEIAYNKLFTTGLSRRDEDEADRIAVDLAQAAGYRASEYANFLESLEKLEGTSELKTLTATHPSPASRISTIKPLLKPEEGVVLGERYEEWTKQGR